MSLTYFAVANVAEALAASRRWAASSSTRAAMGDLWVGAAPDVDQARALAVLEAGGYRLGVIAATYHPADYAAAPRRPVVALADLSGRDHRRRLAGGDPGALPWPARLFSPCAPSSAPRSSPPRQTG